MPHAAMPARHAMVEVPTRQALEGFLAMGAQQMVHTTLPGHTTPCILARPAAPPPRLRRWNGSSQQPACLVGGQRQRANVRLYRIHARRARVAVCAFFCAKKRGAAPGAAGGPRCSMDETTRKLRKRKKRSSPDPEVVQMKTELAGAVDVVRGTCAVCGASLNNNAPLRYVKSSCSVIHDSCAPAQE